MAKDKFTYEELNDFISKYSLYKVIFPKNVIDSVIRLQNVPKNFNELMSPLKLPKDFQDVTVDSFRNPLEKLNDTYDKALLDFSNVNFAFQQKKVATVKSNSNDLYKESLMLDLGDFYSLYENALNYVTLNEDSSTDQDSSTAKTTTPKKSTSKTSSDQILFQIRNYISSVLLNTKQLMQVTVGATQEELNNIDAVVNKAVQTSTQNIDNYISNNNEVIKEFKSNYQEKQADNARKETKIAELKLKYLIALNTHKKEQIEAAENNLKMYPSEYIEFLNTLKSKHIKESKKIEVLKQLYEDSNGPLKEIPLYDGTRVYNEILGIISPAFQRVFNKDPKEWALIKKMNEDGADMIKAATNEIAKAIEIRCNTTVNNSAGKSSDIQVSGQKGSYGHGVPSVGKDRISIRKGVPFQATGLVNLWNRYAAELNNRLNKRVHEVMTCPSLQWLREFCTISIPNLIAMMIVFQHLTYLFRDMNSSVLMNKKDITELNKDLKSYENMLNQYLVENVQKIFQQYKKYASYILKKHFEKINGNPNIEFYINFVKNVRIAANIDAEAVEHLLNGN